MNRRHRSEERKSTNSTALFGNNLHNISLSLLFTCLDWTMTEEAEEGADLSPTSGYEQQAPHFLQDVIFHGKFKVSFSGRDK